MEPQVAAAPAAALITITDLTTALVRVRLLDADIAALEAALATRPRVLAALGGIRCCGWSWGAQAWTDPARWMPMSANRSCLPRGPAGAGHGAGHAHHVPHPFRHCPLLDAGRSAGRSGMTRRQLPRKCWRSRQKR